MAGGIDWFRWHHGSVNDPKFQLVAKRAGASVAEVVAVWACLLESASMAERRGDAPTPDLEAMECALGLAEGLAGRIFTAMQARDLVVNGRVTSWDKRQPKRERADDNSTERVKAFRERERHETPRNASAVTETPREEERREEEKEKDPPASRGPRPTRKCPVEFVVTDEMREWARVDAPGVDVDRQTAKFRDYTFKGAHSDWLATWRNWLREAFDRMSKASPPAQQSFRERDAAARAQRVREMTGGLLDPSQSTGDVIDMEAPNALALR